MSIQTTAPAASGSATPPVETTDPETTPTPTITHYQQLASQFSNAFWQIATIIPNVEKAHPNTVGFVRTHQNVPKPFMASAIVAVEKDSALGVVEKLVATGGRDTLQYEEAFLPIVDELQEFVDNLKFTIALKMATLGVNSLQIYSVAKALARDSNAGDTAAHVAKLKRDLKKTGGRPKKPKAGETPAGTPASPGTSAPAGGTAA